MRIVLSTIAALSLLAWFLLLALAPEPLIVFLENYISQDGIIEAPNLVLRNSSIGLTFLVLMILVFLHQLPVYRADWKHSRWLLERLDLMLILLLFLVHFLTIFWPPARLLIKEDSLLEYLTALLALSSGLLLLLATKSLRDKNNARNFFRNSSYKGLLLLLALALLLLFYGMEEISWGQRLLGVQSPDLFLEHNYQQETTLHNFFNPVLTYAQTVFNLAAAMYLRFHEKIGSKFPTLFPRELEPLLRPHNSAFLSFVFFVLAGQCWVMGGELSEEVLSVVAFFSALRLKYSLKID